MNAQQIEKSKSLLGTPTVEMLLQVHEDALWMLENMGKETPPFDDSDIVAPK